jgi:signal transduction histidine kinase
MVSVVVLLGFFFSRLLTRPVREITAATQKIAAGDLEQRVPVRSHDELGMLATQFNQMSSDLSRATQLRRQMTADIAHDLRSPLTVISGYLEALRDKTLAATPQRFTTLHHEVQTLLHLVEDLHTLSLADAGELSLDRQPVAPGQLLERVAERYRHAAQEHDVELRVQGDRAVPAVNIDLERMTRVVSNLVSNALRYTPRGGHIDLIARTNSHGTNSHEVELVVADTGSGIPPEHLPNIFERSYRADASREQGNGDSGLGLAIVKSIVEAHGGEVAVASTVGEGTVFTMLL